MSTLDFVKRNLNQTLVYWGNPQDNGTGGFTYDSPVEIPGRCEYRVEVVTTFAGDERVSRARVFLDQMIDDASYLYLGTLDDSGVGNDLHPSSTEGSMRVLVCNPIPNLKGDKYLYVAYLNMS